MTRSLPNRPAALFTLTLAVFGALALASRAQDDAADPSAPETDQADAATPKEAAKDVPGGDAAPAPADDDAAADAKEPRDYSGKYLADGVSNGGRAYKAMVEIKRDGEMYQVLWVMGPNEGYMGVGLVEGDALCVGWSLGQMPGVVIYKSDPAADSKKLLGRWTAPGSKGKTFTETLTPLPPRE